LTVVKSNNTELKHVFGKRYRISLNFELIGDHMPLPANDIEDEISFELTVNEIKYVLKYSNDSAKFTMNNISLQFETLNNKELHNRILNQLHYGFSFLFDHVQHLSWQKIKKNEIHFTVDVSVERKSVKGIYYYSFKPNLMQANVIPKNF